jgi:hypothetical protein
MIGGLLLGFLFSLIFSGQLTGKKQPPNKSRGCVKTPARGES